MPASAYPKEYTTKLFPYAAIFERLTKELQTKQADPIAAYVRFQYLRRAADLRSGADYCSTSITSGGHARLLGISMQEKIAKNTLNARQLAAELVLNDALHPRSMIVPVDLGYIPGWSQSDYISLWLAVIAGIDLGVSATSKAAQVFANKLQEQLAVVNLERMNDHEALPADRAPEYFKFAEAWAKLTATHQPEPHSAHRIVSLIDTKDSLGSQTERLFARLRGIPMYNVGFVATNPAASPFHNKALCRDLEMIVAYGGTTVEFISDRAFVLHRAEQQVIV